MKQSLFESRYQPQWQAFAEQLKQLEQGKAKAGDGFENGFPAGLAAEALHGHCTDLPPVKR